jgi:hypothetical protein
MEASTIRIAIRDLPDRFDRSRIPSVLDELKDALLEEAGLHARAHADSFVIALEVPTRSLLKAATTLRSLRLL